jgi:tetratricopeptide (TPR) repeat protein
LSIRERLKTKRFLVISLAFVILIAGVPSTVYAYNQHKYNTLIREAELSVQNDQFDEAVSLYNLAVNYQKKSQAEVAVKIENINTLKESKKVYEDALKQYDLKQYDLKQYLEAMDTFSKVSESDSKRYELAQIKISQCKQQYIETTLQTIRDRASNKEFENALELSESVLKVDPQHLDALNLKQEDTAAMEKIKEEKEKVTKALEEAQKNSTLSSASKTV